MCISHLFVYFLLLSLSLNYLPIHHPQNNNANNHPDVREPHELHQTGTIPTAKNLPITSHPDALFLPAEEFEDKFEFPKPAHDTEVIFYCKAGVRSRSAAGLAKMAGWRDVGEYEGSWMDWVGRGGDVEVVK